MNKFENVDEYIASCPGDVRVKLLKIRTLVKETAPDAQEMIAYGMPAYKLNGKPLCYFAGFKNHIGFYPTPAGIEPFKKDLKKYKTSKGAIQFPIDESVPMELIKKIIQSRVKEIRRY